MRVNVHATGLRVTPLVVTAAGVGALIAWALRDNVEPPRGGDLVSRSLAAAQAAGHHGSAGEATPPTVTGEALASYAGLTAFAMHALMVVVALGSHGLRRWVRQSVVDSRAALVRLSFAGGVAVVSALVTAGMAAVLLGTAISATATVAASVTVLKYSFVVAAASFAVFGVP